MLLPSAGVLDTNKSDGSWLQPASYWPHAKASADWAAEDVVSVWEAHVATMIAACQRRGESDFVASWMYQQCALQPEKSMALQQSQGITV
jgi:hypothetical protein